MTDTTETKDKAVAEVVALCLEVERQWERHPFAFTEDHRPCETGSRVIFSRKIMGILGFCYKCGESLPCLSCGHGL